jgi:hypothetical protein
MEIMPVQGKEDHMYLVGQEKVMLTGMRVDRQER